MKMKKTLAILLTLALVICMIPGSAFANTEGGAVTEGSGEPTPTPVAISSVTLSDATALYGFSTAPTVTVKATGVAADLTAGTDYDCFLQVLFGQSCKTFLDIVACPNWTKLQSLGWLRINQPKAIADII